MAFPGSLHGTIGFRACRTVHAYPLTTTLDKISMRVMCSKTFGAGTTRLIRGIITARLSAAQEIKSVRKQAVACSQDIRLSDLNRALTCVVNMRLLYAVLYGDIACTWSPRQATNIDDTRKSRGSGRGGLRYKVKPQVPTADFHF